MNEGDYINIIWEQSRTIEELNNQVKLLSFELTQIKKIFGGNEKDERQSLGGTGEDPHKP